MQPGDRVALTARLYTEISQMLEEADHVKLPA
jgi:hypothetical protein